MPATETRSSRLESRTGSSVASFLGRTGHFFQSQIWLWPIIAAVGLGSLGWFVRTRVERSIQSGLESQLALIRDMEVAALRHWADGQIATVRELARDIGIRTNIIELAALDEAKRLGDLELIKAPAAQRLQSAFNTLMSVHGYAGFMVASRDQRVLVAAHPEIVGKRSLAGYDGFLPQALQGRALLSRPFSSVALLADEQGRLRAGRPTMFAAAPVTNNNGVVIGVLCLRLLPQREFAHFLSLARYGRTSETYAFDSSGRLMSPSRFEAQLKSIGLLPDSEDSRAMLNLELRDPGGDLTAGFRSRQPRNTQPLTLAVSNAIAGRTGVNIDGYRDYRGAQVLGAWTWLPEVGMGIVTEVEAAEAYQPLRILRLSLWGLFGLLALSSVVLFVFMLIMARMERAARRAVVQAKKLGQYTLDEEIGSGANGTVYRAHHALLRRPTAVKLLNVEHVTETSIARFEREVQLTSGLNHPNTICIYDYGRTPEGVFYYAMEFLDGINLNQLVKRFGAQPEGRVIHILRQICGSLAEAHAAGLIHRDIKPANVILNVRGGLYDHVKVLDFGLVKAINHEHLAEKTANDAVVGTPLYLSPEAIENPAKIDSLSDLYSVGAVGYFLLTGKPMFEVKDIADVLLRQTREMPVRPSERLGRPVGTDLEDLLMSCLAKDRSLRPADAWTLEERLSRCRAAGEWTRPEAEQWWRKHGEAIARETSKTGSEKKEIFATATLVD
jgi:hypothetical protein